jgi:hypothetical protein
MRSSTAAAAAAAATTTSQRQLSSKRSMVLTDTHSDYKCLAANANVFQRFLYKVSLHNGGYMLNAYERFALNVLVWTCLYWVGRHVHAFFTGLAHGLEATTTTGLPMTG